MRFAALVALSLGASITPCFAETDPFLAAVGFALTGSDNTVVKIKHKSNCIFQIGDQVFYLNNVQTDRLRYQSGLDPVMARFGKQHIIMNVFLHGAKTVVEEFKKPPIVEHETDDVETQNFNRGIKEKMPEMFRPIHSTFNEYTLELSTNETERVTRAWLYIYQHGCTGSKSQF